jgi:hypothetical protein
MPGDVSAVIVNHNAGRLLQACVASVLPQVREVVVVDNASTDDSLALMAEIAATDRLRIVRNGKNRGFAAACNAGIANAGGEALLFLNPDCAIAEGAVSVLRQALSANAAAGMVGGLLLNPDGSEQGGGRRAVPTPWRSFVRAFGLGRLSRRWPRLFADHYLHREPLPVGPIAVEAISGACMMVKRQAIAQVGSWDEGYFLHCEDLDWCMRFRQSGWKILFVPAARVTHVLGASSRRRPIFVEWHKHKGMMRFYRKFFRHQYPGILMGLVAVGVWSRFAALAAWHVGAAATRAARNAARQKPHSERSA